VLNSQDNNSGNIIANLSLLKDIYPTRLHHEDAVYKVSEEGEMKKFLLVLNDNELFYFKDDNGKNEFKQMYNLSGCFVEKNGIALVNNVKYYCFSIYFSGKYRNFYTLSKEATEIWVEKIKASLGNRDINEFYDIQEQIGKGSFGSIKLAINKRTKEKVAVKVVQKKTAISVELVYFEIQIMKKCNNQNIVKYIDHFETSKAIYIVMEYLAGTTLSDYLKSRTSMSEKSTAKIIYQIANGINYLHSIDVVHRDIKPSNVILLRVGNKLQVKIIDFGLSKILGKEESLNEFAGSMIYSAPEVVRRDAYNTKVDIWSLGMVIYFMMCRQFPFDNDTDRTFNRKLDFQETAWKSSSEEVMNLITLCLDDDQFGRINIEDLINHQWFKNY